LASRIAEAAGFNRSYASHVLADRRPPSARFLEALPLEQLSGQASPELLRGQYDVAVERAAGES